MEIREEERDAARVPLRLELLDQHVVGEGFGSTPEQQADTHPGGEEHGQPRHRAELRLVRILTQLDAAVGRHRKHDADQQDEWSVK